MMNRRLRSLLDLVNPTVLAKKLPSTQETQARDKVEQEHNRWNKQRRRSPKYFDKEEKVWVRSYRGHKKWYPGVVEEKLGDRHYQITVNIEDQELRWKRHVDQIRKRI